MNILFQGDSIADAGRGLLIRLCTPCGFGTRNHRKRAAEGL